MTKLRYGLIGCGRIAINHIEAVKKNSHGIEPVCLCDIVPSKMDKLLDKSSLPADAKSKIRKYTDYKEMLDNEGLDLVAIATESGKHAAIAADCIKKGINVIVEKPMALSIKDADALINLADERRVKLCVSHQNRFNKSITKIREAYERNRFGKLLYGTVHVRWCRDRQYYSQADWRGTWEQDGGALMNQCIHSIDLLRWMMGDEISEVFAYTDNLIHPYIEGEDLGLALIKFKNGAYGVVEGTSNVFPRNLEETMYLFGKKGTVKVGGKSLNIIEEWKFADGLDREEEIKEKFRENPPNIYGYGHNPLYRDMVDAIVNDRQPYIDGREGKKALELVLAIYKSSRDRKPVKLPLDNFSTLDMVGALGACGKA